MNFATFWKRFDLPQVKWCWTSNTKHIEYMQVVSQVAEHLKTHDPRKLGNISKMSKYVGDRP